MAGAAAGPAAPPAAPPGHVPQLQPGQDRSAWQIEWQTELVTACPGLAGAGLGPHSGWSGAPPALNRTCRRFMVRRRSTVRFRKGAPGYEDVSNLESSTSFWRVAFEWQRSSLYQALRAQCIERLLSEDKVRAARAHFLGVRGGPADVCGASPRRLAIRGARLSGGGEDRVVPGSVRWPGGLIVRPQPAVCHEPGGQRDVFCFGLLGRFADGARHCAIPRSAGKSRVLYLSRWLVRRWRSALRVRSGGGSRRAAGVRRRRIRRRSGPSRCSSPSKGAAVRSCGRVAPG